METISKLGGVLLMLVVSGGLTGTGLAQAPLTIALEGVPSRLAYPLPDGSNTIVTATIGGGVAEEVWLAVQAGDARRVELSPSGDGRFQINLADHRVRTLLRDAGERGQFAIHARPADGSTTSSVPISYSFFRHDDDRPHWVLRSPTRSISGRGLDRSTWIDVDSIGSVEWYFGPTTGAEPIAAIAGNERWPMELDEERGSAVLTVDDPIRAAWLAAGSLNLRSDQRPLFTFHVRPTALELSSGAASFEVWQRRSASVPGSRRYLTVSLGDITGGQVWLELRDADRVVRVPGRSVRAGEVVPFTLGDSGYELGIDRLVNVLIGEDHAEITVAARGAWHGLRIERFLAWLPTVEVVFVRNGSEFDGAAAAEHLRRKYESARDRIRTFDEFIENIASRSSTSGLPYEIRLADGTTVEAGPWLRDKFEREAPAPKRESRD